MVIIFILIQQWQLLPKSVTLVVLGANASY